ncbi:MAG: HlyD family secretion protein [Alphaproteobacteria bacterium]|nr:HlyD family secretion protein [Alphaproteobacteria bacterium]
MNELAPKKETAIETPALDEVVPTRRGKKLFAIARGVLLLTLMVAMAAWAIQWARTSVLFVHETDARIMADLISISSEVDGRLKELLVTEGDRITLGQTVAVLDARSVSMTLTETKAERATAAAELIRVEAETRMIAQQTESRIQSERSKLAVSEANQSVYAHEFGFAKNDFHRIEKLAKSGAVSKSRLDRARTDFLKARQELQKAEAEITTARALLDEASVDRARLMVKKAETAELEAHLAEIEARIARQKVDIADRTIVSPIDGVVGQTFVQPGEYLSSGQRVLVVHDPSRIWVESNIRETEVGRLSVELPVRVEVDAYPDTEFNGRVSRIGDAATSQFALLPRLNDSGTFTKITQRIEVRIELEAHEKVLKPGMMVEIYVDDGAAGRFWSWLR